MSSCSLENREEMEVTRLPSDDSDSEYVEGSDTNHVTEQNDAETKRANPEDADSYSLLSVEKINSAINDSAVKNNICCDTRNVNSIPRCNDGVTESTDNATPVQKHIWENVQDSDVDCSTKAKLTEENNENCSLIVCVEGMTSALDSSSTSSMQYSIDNCGRTEQSTTCEEKINTEDCAAADGASNQSRDSAEVVDQLEESELCEEGTIKIINQEDDNNLSKAKREKDNLRTSILNKSCSGSSKKFQLEIKQQSSEIKDRVMSFLTKYASVDESSIVDEDRQAFSKDESSKEIKSHVCSEITGVETVEELNCNDSELNENLSKTVVPSSTDAQLNAPVVLKDTVSCESFLQPSSILSQTRANENIQQLIVSSFTPEPSSQTCKFVFSTPNSEKLLAACAPAIVSSENGQHLPASNDNSFTECDSNAVTNMECCTVESTAKTKADVFSFEQKGGNMSTDLSSKMLNTLQPLNSSPSSWIQSECSQYSTLYKDISSLKHQCELNRNISTCSKPFEFNNSFVGNKMPCPLISKNLVFASNQSNSFLNQTTHMQYGNNTNTVPESTTFSSWGKLSFQPLTTPSINSPIFSCISSNDTGATKQASSFPDYLLASSAQTNNVTSSLPLSSPWSPKNCTKSRRTRSSEAIFNSMPIPLASGGTTFFNNINSNSQVFKNSYCGKTIVNKASEFSSFGFGKPSNTAGINMNENLHGIFGSTVGKSANVLCNTTPITSSVCYGSLLANGPSKESTENPFSKRCPVETIGLFKSSLLKPTVGEIGNPVFKSVSSSTSILFPPKREKIEEAEKVECDRDNIDVSKQDILKNNTQLSVLLSSDDQNNQKINTTTGFGFGNAICLENPKPLENCIFGSEQTSNEDSKRQSSCANSGTYAPQINSNSVPFQFTFNAEKTKSYFANRVAWSRPTRKPVKTYRLHDKGFSKCVKESSSVFNTLEKGSGHVAFKPVYGSDVRVELGVIQNVIVRYQNIVFMEEYINISPEELRSQYYVKTRVSGPFKFSTCTNSQEIHSEKKTQNQEIQTEKQLTPKKTELAGIWRALECPVCFDVVLPPVYQCEQGHHVCSTCWNKVITCPLCKRLKSGTRNYMAEALVEQVPLPCRYHIEGCKETVQHMNKVNHEETCTYRMYECPVPLCNQAHSYPNMCKHFKKAHKTLLHHEGHSVGKGEKFCDVLYKEALSLFLIHAFDITKWGLFFLRKVTVHNSSALFVQIMPAVADQAAYFYHLEVSDHHDCRKECYKGRVFPMGKPTVEIVDQEEYLCLSDLILKTVNKNTPLKIVVTIWQLKPAFTLSTE